MTFIEVLQEYFKGEGLLGWALLGVGLGLGGAVALLVGTQQAGAFRNAMVYPLAFIAVAMVVGGPIMAHGSAAKSANLTTAFGLDPRALVTDEGERMAKVNANWLPLKATWATLGVVGMVLIFVHKDWSSGLGLVLVFVCCTGFYIDVFAERRADTYTAALGAYGTDADL